MCGIAGMVGLYCDNEIKTNMLKTMHRRGPDECGEITCGNCTLLHSRLSIIDLDGGKQPMTASGNDQNYTIVYNGELYNAQELRGLLQKSGHTFKGHSDTEVVLHAYIQWNEGCLDRLNGIFAFAILEHKRKKLFLARDRMGVKPLFYKLHNGGLLFASEIKTILAYPDVKAQINAEGVAEVLLLGPGRSPGNGVFKDILELEPGCYGYYMCSKWNWKRYWWLRDREHNESFEDTAEHVRYLVTDAIRRQMVSDVPLGTFLSGGLDSSLISSVCATEYKKKGMKLQTFSLDYKDNDKYFVPEKFRPVFLEATLMHHENLDGTGYPDGLEGSQIPPIAKMIRLVESFIAQISKRNYRGIFDKETALEELRKHPEWYDQEIVDILDKLI